MSAKNIIEMVNVNGQSEDSEGKWTMEKIRSDPHTVTIPPPKTCTTSTRSQALWVSVIEDDTTAGVLREWTVCNDVSWVVAEGAKLVQAETWGVAKAVAKRTIVSSATILGVAWGTLMTSGTLVLWAVDTKMPHEVAVKTTSLISCQGFWAQTGISRCNSSGIRSGSALMESRMRVSGVV